MPVWRIAALAALALLALLPASALADADHESSNRESPRLQFRAPERASLGEEITVEALLTDPDGQPIEHATITLLSPVSWAGEATAEGEEGHADTQAVEKADAHQEAEGGQPVAEAGEENHADSEANGHGGEAGGHSEEGEEGHHGDFSGEMVLSTAQTDPSGIASFTPEVRRSGEITLTARFDGDEHYGPASASSSVLVEGNYQLYTPQVGIRIPGLGPWLLATVIGGLWSLYFVVALLVFAIARSPAMRPVPAEATAGAAASESRRRFLTRLAVPLGMQAAIASIGLGLITLVARAPYTHGNLENYSTGSGYRRTPFAPVGRGKAEKRPIPPPLDREVSFTREVHPIFLTKGGPHAMPPDNSPPPGGVRLDSYEHIMEKEDLVVPGRPEESELVSVLLDPAMRMPPSASPLPDEEIQLIVSWIAQGARYN